MMRSYTGLAPWSERAWHGAVVFKGKYCDMYEIQSNRLQVAIE